jgi:hypothetical protein
LFSPEPFSIWLTSLHVFKERISHIEEFDILVYVADDDDGLDLESVSDFEERNKLAASENAEGAVNEYDRQVKDQRIAALDRNDVALENPVLVAVCKTDALSDEEFAGGN